MIPVCTLVDTYYYLQCFGVFVLTGSLVCMIWTFRKISGQLKQASVQTGILQEQLNFNISPVPLIIFKTVDKVEAIMESQYLYTEQNDLLMIKVKEKFKNIKLLTTEYIAIEISNHGFSDISSIDLCYNCYIDISTLDTGKSANDNTVQFQRIVRYDKLLKCKEDPVTIVLFQSTYFPQHELILSGTCKDVRGKEYSIENKTFKGSVRDFGYIDRLQMESKQVIMPKS